MLTQREKLDRRITDLYSERSRWEPVWKDIRDYVMPFLGYFSNEEQVNDGDKPDSLVIDGTAIMALNVLASGMQAGLTPQSRPWFRLDIEDPEMTEWTPARLWLDDVQSLMYSVLAKSNFYRATHAVYGDIATFGTAAMYMEENYKTVIHCRPFTCGEYALGTGADGTVNTFARKIKLNAFQMVELFGEEAVSRQVKDAYRNKNGTTYFEVYHLIEPSRHSEYGPFKKAYISTYWEPGEKDKLLQQGGYDSFPIMAPRWGVKGNDTYGMSSPGWWVLSDTKMLQKMQENTLIALEKMINPPIAVPTGVNLVNILPGGVTFIDPASTAQNMTVKPIFEVKPDIKSNEYKIERVQDAIKQRYFVDMFLVVSMSERQMTAREVIEKNAEKMSILGPVVEQLQTEFLTPIIERVFDIMDKNGVLPPPPPEIQGQPWKVTYTSLFAQAQKMVGLTSLEQYGAFIGSLAAVKADVLDKLNAEQMADEYAEMLGLPAGVVNPDDVVAQIRAERAKQAQAQQAMAGAMAIAQGAKVLADADTGGNNALTALMGGPAGG